MDNGESEPRLFVYDSTVLLTPGKCDWRSCTSDCAFAKKADLIVQDGQGHW